MRVGTVSSYIFSEPREGTTGRHCVPGTLDDGSRDEKKKKNRDKTMKVESTGGKRERARETRKEEKKGEWMSAFRASF